MEFVETTDPLSVQLTNRYPAEGVAETVTDVPESKVPPPVVVPPAEGLDDVAIEKVWMKLAVSTRLDVIGKL